MKTQFEEWLDKANEKRKEDYLKEYPNGEYKPLTYSKGRKFVKIVATYNGNSRSVWGFVSMFDGTFKKRPVKMGDLLKPAGWKAPAAISRGNIFEGTDRWNYYGPAYIK